MRGNAISTPLVLSAALGLGLSACGASATDDDATDKDAQESLSSTSLALESPRGQVSQANLSEHLDFLAAHPRTATDPSQHLARSRTYCKDKLSALGYTIYEESFTNETNPWPQPPATASGTNIHGYKLGTTLPNELVMVSAHIDSVENCPGANDNASGVAGVLEVARILAEAPHRRTTIATCWDAEEAGSVGSWVYASRARYAGYNIKINFVFDSIGWSNDKPKSQELPGDSLFATAFPKQAEWVTTTNDSKGNFIGVAGNGLGLGGSDGAWAYRDKFTGAAAALNLPVVSIMVPLVYALPLMDVFRSDHASFWLKGPTDPPGTNGYNALFITDTGEFRKVGEALEKPYHCGQVTGIPSTDSIDKINVGFARKVVQATAETMKWAADR